MLPQQFDELPLAVVGMSDREDLPGVWHGRFARLIEISLTPGKCRSGRDDWTAQLIRANQSSIGQMLTHQVFTAPAAGWHPLP